MKILKKYFKNHKKEFYSFSEITQVRLVGLVIFLFIINLYMPIITSLKGIYLTIFGLSPATIIALFSIASIAIVKISPWLMKNVKFSNLYLLSIILNSLFIISGLLYFYSPSLFVWIDSFISIFDAAVYWALSNTFSNYIHYFEPESYSSFQNYRMIIISEVEIVAFTLSAILTGFFSYGISILALSIVGIILFIYQISKLKMFKKYDFVYMYRYHKDLKEQEKRKNNIKIS